MKQVQNILLATDLSVNSDNLYHYTIELAQRTNARVIVMNALNILIPQDPYLPVTVMEEMNEQRGLAVQKELERLCQIIRSFKNDAGGHIPCVGDKEIFDPVSSVQRITEKEQIDLLIMGTHHEGLFYQLFGNTSTEVIKQVHCPVLIVPPEASYKTFRNICYATDLRDDEDSRLVDFMKFARLFNSHVNIIHVYPHNPGDHEVVSYEVLKDEFRTQCDYGKVQFEEIVHSSPIEAIKTFVSVKHCDLLVLLKYKRGVFAELFHKSVNKHMILNSKIPVLILHEN